MPKSPASAPSLVSKKAERFVESVIREMTREAMKHDAVNLAQGFPDFPAPEAVKRAAAKAIHSDINQYAITWGAKSLRDAIARQMKVWQGIGVDPETQITVCCGATEAMLSALLAVCDPGDEIIIFEPFYENYGPDAILSAATPRFVTLHPPEEEEGEWTFDPGELREAFTGKTRALILNTPHNPTGKVFSREEMETIRDLCIEFNALVITDEVYEHILYDGREHISIASIDGMRERTITLNGLSKTYSVTGWRVGWAVASPQITSAIRKVHDFVTVGAPAPLQEAGAAALALPESYYTELAAGYLKRRDKMLAHLRDAGFKCYVPRGAYYIMTEIGKFGFPDDVVFTRHMVKNIGVAAVPGSSFYDSSRKGFHQVRFCFSKQDATLDKAGRRLHDLKKK